MGKRVVPAILMTLLFYVAAAALFSLLGLRVFMFVWENRTRAAAALQEYS